MDGLGPVRDESRRWMTLQPLLSALVVILLGLAMHLGRLGEGELHHEEARRALPAREMLASGDFVQPTIWGRPYLAKPPLYFWAVAAAARGVEGGNVTAFAVRLPALLGALATALVVLAAVRRLLGPSEPHREGAALASALSIIVAPEMASKAGLGEIDTVFAFMCAAAFATSLLAVREQGAKSWCWTVAAGAATGLALLTKGPLALVVGPGPLIAWSLADRGRNGSAVRLLLAAAISLSAAGLWYAALVGQYARGDEAIATFSRELGRGGAGGAQLYLADRGSLLAGVTLGWLPVSSVLLVALLSRRARAALWSDGIARSALPGALPGLVTLALWPAVRARYALPLLPAAALAAAPLFASWLRPGEQALPSPLRRAVTAPFQWLRALMLVVMAALVLHALDRGLGTHWLGRLARESDFLSPWWAAPALLVAVLLLQKRREFLVAGVLAGLWVVLSCIAEIERRRDVERHGRAAGARVLERAAEGAPLAIDHWGEFNLLFELAHPPRWVDSPVDVPLGFLLLRAANRGAPGPTWSQVPAGGWSAQERVRTPELERLSLWRRDG